MNRSADIDPLRARALQSGLEEVLFDREQKIVDRIIVAVRANDCSYEWLYGQCCRLVELRDLALAMERNVRREIGDMEEAHG